MTEDQLKQALEEILKNQKSDDSAAEGDVELAQKAICW